MKNILKKTAFLIFAAASLLVMSCSEIAEEKTEKSATSAGSGTLIFSGTELARTINPTVSADLTDFKKVTLLGAYNSGSDTVLGTWDTMAAFQSAKVEGVKIGSWVLTLRAETLATGGAVYSDTQTVTVQGGTNAVSFSLSRTSLGTGNGTIAIVITVPTTVKAAEVLVDGTAVSATLASSKISYTDNTKAGGQYTVTVKFYGDEAKKLFLNSMTNVVNVGAGLTTTWSETISDVDSIYQITYNANEGTMPGSYQTYYTINSGVSSLPRPTKSGYLFKGWFDNAGLSGAEVTSIATGSTGNKTLYAKWEEYVAPTITSWDFTSWSAETKANILADYAKTTWTRSDSDTSGNVSRYKSPNLKTEPVVANGVPVAELEGLLVEGNVSVSWDSSKGVCLQTAATITIPVEGGKPVVFKFANTGSSNGTRKVKITENGVERELGSSSNTTVVEKTYTPAASTTSIIMKCYDKDGNVGKGGLNFFSIKGPVHATGISLAVDGANSIAMKEGVSKEITATITPSDALEKADPITWSSDKSAIVEVVNGVLVPKAVSSETVTITATTSNGVSGTLTITGVTETVKPNSVSISCGGATTIAKLAVGSSKTITATFTPADVEATALTWDSSNPNVVSVVNGVITGVAAGTNVTITATTVNGKTDSITISEVVDPSSVTDSIVFKDEGGWLESAFAEWYPVSNGAVDGYNAYVKATTSSTWTKLDKELIRGYSNTAGGRTVDYYRVDALGLKAGTYQIKVVATMDGTESGINGMTGNLTVAAHDRSGFAFTGSGVPGAYKADGTLKDGAIVVYADNSTFNTLTITVNKDNKGGTITFTGVQGIVNNDGYIKYAQYNGNKAICIRIIGKIDINGFPKGSWKSSAEGLQIKGNSAYQEANLTVEGVGYDATFRDFGVLIRSVSYVELRNIAFMLFADDGISIDQDDKYLWIHNLDIFYGGTGGDSDQAKGDGSLDSKDATLSTYSYNHFWDSGKCNLLDNGTVPYSYTSGALYLTYHHNWYDHSDSRHPRVRFDNVHVYNNYYDGNSKYGVGSTTGSSVFVENNYFRNCKFPMLTSCQGNDVYAGSSTYNKNNGTFSGEEGGIIKAFNNYITGSTSSYAAYGASQILMKGKTVASSGYFDTTRHFDAYEVANRNDTIPNTIHPIDENKNEQTQHHYSNFDTTVDLHATVQTPTEAKATVMQYAGRSYGGDFRWTFTEADDTDYSVNSALKSALASHKTAISLTNLDGSTGGGSDPDPNPDPTTPTITLNPTTLTLTAGGATGTITATASNGATITWTSSNTSVATVNNGVVTPLTAGTTTITASATGATPKTCAVTVNAGGGGNTGGGGSSGTWTCPSEVSIAANESYTISGDLQISPSIAMETKSGKASTISGNNVTNLLYSSSNIAKTSGTANIKFSANAGNTYSVTLHIALTNTSDPPAPQAAGTYAIGSGTATALTTSYSAVTFTVVGGTDVTVTISNTSGSARRMTVGLIEYTKLN